jgi:hypothetical protein
MPNPTRGFHHQAGTPAIRVPKTDVKHSKATTKISNRVSKVLNGRRITHLLSDRPTMSRTPITQWFYATCLRGFGQRFTRRR